MNAARNASDFAIVVVDCFEVFTFGECRVPYRLQKESAAILAFAYVGPLRLV